MANRALKKSKMGRTLKGIGPLCAPGKLCYSFGIWGVGLGGKKKNQLKRLDTAGGEIVMKKGGDFGGGGERPGHNSGGIFGGKGERAMAGEGGNG